MTMTKQNDLKYFKLRDKYIHARRIICNDPWFCWILKCKCNLQRIRESNKAASVFTLVTCFRYYHCIHCTSSQRKLHRYKYIRHVYLDSWILVIRLRKQKKNYRNHSLSGSIEIKTRFRKFRWKKCLFLKQFNNHPRRLWRPVAGRRFLPCM